MEDARELIHKKCGQRVDRQVQVPGWDRFHFEGACGHKGQRLVPSLEVQGIRSQVLYFDVTVHHSVPTGDLLVRASDGDSAAQVTAEQTKYSRYPARRCPHRVVPLAVETFGRHGPRALKYQRKLARRRAEALDENGDEAVSCLVLRWGCQLSVALQRADVANLLRCVGAQDRRTAGLELASGLAD